MARRKTLPLILIGVTATVVVVGVAMFALSVYQKGRSDPDVVAEMAANRKFAEDHKTELLQLAERLDAIEAMVKSEDWPATEELVASIQQKDPIILWAHELRGKKYPEFDDIRSGRSYTDLEDLEPMLPWANDPSMAGGYSASDVALWAKKLDRATERYIVVAELHEVVMPKITELHLGDESGEMGRYTAGRTTFGVAVIDTQSMRVVARGQGSATSSDEVRAIDGPGQDLWQRTRDAVGEVTRRVTGQSP